MYLLFLRYNTEIPLSNDFNENFPFHILISFPITMLTLGWFGYPALSIYWQTVYHHQDSTVPQTKTSALPSINTIPEVKQYLLRYPPSPSQYKYRVCACFAACIMKILAGAERFMSRSRRLLPHKIKKRKMLKSKENVKINSTPLPAS